MNKTLKNVTADSGWFISYIDYLCERKNCAPLTTPLKCFIFELPKKSWTPSEKELLYDARFSRIVSFPFWFDHCSFVN